MKTWFLGLLNAIINGAAMSASTVAINPDTLNNPKVIGTVAASGAVLGLINYLKKSPIK